MEKRENRETFEQMPPENLSVITMDDIREASMLELYYQQKIIGKLTPGSEGLALLMGALETGIGILMTIIQDGAAVFCIEPKPENKEDRLFLEDPDDPESIKLINVCYYLESMDDASLFPVMTATKVGIKGERTITVCNLTTSNSGDNDFDLQLASERTWSSAKNKISRNLIWVEAQFTKYGVIRDPLTPISIIGMSDTWDDHIADDEYWANLHKEDMAYERQKLIETRDAEEEKAENAEEESEEKGE
jgi:hypothetical protein